MAAMTVLTTLAAVVSPTGITSPALSDILDTLTSQFQGIYGTDVYLGPDSIDGQWLGILAQAIYDSNQTAVAVYNQFSPATAVGAGLSSVVKINGLLRAAASNSSVDLVIVGQAYTTITNGVVGDNQNLGTQWGLPSSVTIPSSGTITVTATNLSSGAIAAAAGTLTVILTPTPGWQSVTNPAAAALGAPVQTDAQLRVQQATSTNLPALTVVDACVGALLSLSGVTSVNYDVNNSDTTDANGVPPYSWSFSVLGGTIQDIVNTIGLYKTPGPPTYGTTSGTYTSPYGINETINFFVTAQQRIVVSLTITPKAGYTSTIGTEIQNAIAAYINSLAQGQAVQISKLAVPALLQGPYASPASPNDAFTYDLSLSSLAAAIYPNTPSTSDIAIAFNQIATCQPSDVTITT